MKLQPTGRAWRCCGNEERQPPETSEPKDKLKTKLEHYSAHITPSPSVWAVFSHDLLSLLLFKCRTVIVFNNCLQTIYFVKKIQVSSVEVGLLYLL